MIPLVTMASGMLNVMAQTWFREHIVERTNLDKPEIRFKVNCDVIAEGLERLSTERFDAYLNDVLDSCNEQQRQTLSRLLGLTLAVETTPLIKK